MRNGGNVRERKTERWPIWLAVLLTAALCVLLGMDAAPRETPRQTVLRELRSVVCGTSDGDAAQMGLLGVTRAEEGWYVDVLVSAAGDGVHWERTRVLVSPDGTRQIVSREPALDWPG